MNSNDFNTRFRVMLVTLKFAPKDEGAVDIWYGLARKQMSDEEINRAFAVCLDTMNQFPSWMEFKEAGQKGAILNLEDEAAKMTGKIMAEFSNNRAVATSSSGLLCAAGSEFYKNLGGHSYWYDIMSGVPGCRVPTESQMYKKVLAFLREKKNEEVNEKVNERLTAGGSQNAARLPTST